jgi:DNA (cytosine-5)-methyltransferase 1
MVAATASLERDTLERPTNETESGLGHHYEKEKRAGIILQTMQDADEKTAIFIWSVGGLGSIYEARFLFEEMSERKPGEGGCNPKSISLEGKANARHALCALRLAESITGPSSGQEPGEQQTRELVDALRGLSQHIALAGVIPEKEARWKLCVNHFAWERITPALPTKGIGSGLWQTPTVQDGNGRDRHNQRDGTTIPSLLGQVKSWPTPTTRDWRSGKSNQHEKNSRPLNEVAQLAAGGNTTRPMTLNPDWVEWLMGWPVGWTDLKPLAMDKFQKWLDSHGRH